MKCYILKLGTGNPADFTGLSPTFIQWRLVDTGGVTIPPGISEIAVGSGLYRFEYEPGQSLPIVFVADGGAAITSAGARYLTGTLDPIQSVDLRLGWDTDSIGGTLANPVSVYAFVERIREFLEGQQNFNKTTGALLNYDRGGTLLLRASTLTNTSGAVTKED
jgi:hypothetical protein